MTTVFIGVCIIAGFAAAYCAGYESGKRDGYGPGYRDGYQFGADFVARDRKLIRDQLGKLRAGVGEMLGALMDSLEAK